MKVLLVHNFHRTGSASGDDQVFENEAKLLEDHGVEVRKYSVSNDEFDRASVIEKIKLTIGMFWSFRHYSAVRDLVRREKPDIVHVHTFFPLLSPSILYAAKRSGAKVIATLHDTRLVCPCATSLRGEDICNDCRSGNYLKMCWYKCYKGSCLMSCIVACVFCFHRLRKSFYSQIDKYICLNDSQITVLNSAGFSKDKMIKKYNFVECSYKTNGDDVHSVYGLPDRYVVYFGRLGIEKGIKTLMKIWDDLNGIPLVIVGSGPLEKEVADWAGNRKEVFFLGYQHHDVCLEIVRYAEFVVFFSIWYEGCSMVEIESEMMGKAIIASDIGFSKELITDGGNGFLTPIGDVERSRNRINELWNDEDKCKRMGLAARQDYDVKFNRESNYMQLIRIYDSVLSADNTE